MSEASLFGFPSISPRRVQAIFQSIGFGPESIGSRIIGISSSYLSSCPPLLVAFPEGYKIIHIPESIRHASSYRRRHAKCTMNLDEVVGEIIEGVVEPTALALLLIEASH